MKFGIYFGCNIDPNYDNYKLDIINELPKNWEIYLFYSKKPDRTRINHPNVKIVDFYSDDIFTRSLSDTEIQRQERWLGHPFGVLIQSNYVLKKPLAEIEDRRTREFLAQLTIAWKRILEKNEINVFSVGLECGFTETVSLHVAKKLKTRIIHPMPGRLTKTFSVIDHTFNPIYWNNPSEDEVKEGYSKVIKIMNGKWFLNPQFRNDNKKRMEFNILNLIARTLRYHELYSRLHPIEKKRYKTTKQLIYEYLVKKVRMIFFKSFFAKKADLSERFFLFPLHFEEDAQLTSREPFINQMQLIKQISSSLPTNVKLFVKPHPHYFCTDIEIGMINSLSKIPNVVLIDTSISNEKLIPASLGVITINSTVGFEAIVRDKPVIAFGRDFYSIPGVCIVLRDVSELPSILFSVMQNPNYRISKIIRKRFLGTYACNIEWLEGCLRWEWFNFTREDYRKIAKMIVKVLEIPTNKEGSSEAIFSNSVCFI